MKTLLLLVTLLCCTMITFAQRPIDANGYSLKTTKAIPNFTASTIDSNYVNIDTLHFQTGYSPGPGQFSKDGLEYYLSLEFQSVTSQLYVLKRSALKEQFGSPELLTGSIADTSSFNYEPTISADKKTIVFVRASFDSWTKTDLYIATRTDISLPFDSIRALSEINSTDTADAYPCISPDALRLYFTKGNDQFDSLYVSSRQSTNDPFGTPELLHISFPKDRNFSCWLTNDEKELFFTTGQNGDSAMYSTRTD